MQDKTVFCSFFCSSMDIFVRSHLSVTFWMLFIYARNIKPYSLYANDAEAVAVPNHLIFCLFTWTSFDNLCIGHVFFYIIVISVKCIHTWRATENRNYFIRFGIFWTLDKNRARYFRVGCFNSEKLFHLVGNLHKRSQKQNCSQNIIILMIKVEIFQFFKHHLLFWRRKCLVDGIS